MRRRLAGGHSDLRRGRSAQSRQRTRASIDEWMTTLFWMDSPKPLEAAWSMERVERCWVQIWSTASQVASQRDAMCVLNVGFSQTASRARFVSLTGEAGLSVQLHFLDIPAGERWDRVEARNASKGDTYHLPFDVAREMFEFVEILWEPPTREEMLACNGIRVSSIADQHSA